MSDNYRNRLESYLASMLQAKRMLSMGIITPEDYADIDTIMNEKYGISSCSLYCGMDLIYDGFVTLVTLALVAVQPVFFFVDLLKGIIAGFVF